jgi:hypothetical protein
LTELVVTFSKLERYCGANGGYDIERHDSKVTLTFVPSFPEAQDKGDPDNPPPRIFMHGKIVSNRVHFTKVEVEDEQGIREKEMGEARLTYEAWLQFIEENY